MAVAPGGAVHAAFSVNPGEQSPSGLSYLFRDSSGSVSGNAVDSVGYDGAIAADASGGVHIAYRDVNSFGLKYAYRSPNLSAWSITPVDNGFVSSASIAVDASGVIHVAYVDHAAGTIRYARRQAGVWSTSTVATLPLAGHDWAHASLALDAKGGVHLAYLDWYDADLEYAYRCP
jgi:hypothetical protein